MDFNLRNFIQLLQNIHKIQFAFFGSNDTVSYDSIGWLQYAKKKMKLHIEVQSATQFSSLPAVSQLREWIYTTLQMIPMNLGSSLSELTIRFIDREESATLNESYRNKKGPTNVLSFSNDPIPGLPFDLSGDLAICAPVVAEEANAQNKPLKAHFAHLIIHGILHLLGYDHIKAQEAAEMERLEIKVLSQLGYKDPYKDG